MRPSHEIESDHVSTVTDVLQQKRDSAPWKDIPEGHFPVRLQVLDFEPFDFNVKVGDPGYDKDHSGYWGASTISEGDSVSQLEEIAYNLLCQALDHYSQSEAV